MPKMIFTHEVDDVAHWLSSPKREEVFAGVMTNIQTYVVPGEANRVALTGDVADLDALETVLKGPAGAEAMKFDGVRPDTIVTYMEG